jgi:hypothetical protein
VLESTLYFLDMSGWMCSIELGDLAVATYYTRHFFIPPTWHTGGPVVISLVSKTTVAFARGKDLVMFHGYLDLEMRVCFKAEAALA